MLLHKRRLKRGALELSMPETELEFDAQGRVTGAHFVKHDLSHQIIEEFMLSANEAVAEHLGGLGVAFLRRIHPAPEPNKLKVFAEFARLLGYKIKHETDRFALQRILEQHAAVGAGVPGLARRLRGRAIPRDLPRLSAVVAPGRFVKRNVYPASNLSPNVELLGAV